MSDDFLPLERRAIPLLLGIAGGTGSGKTFSALRVARGLAGEHPFAGIDTENGRMNHYAEFFPEVRAKQIKAPFRPASYTQAINQAEDFLEKQAIPGEHRVIVVDSGSHEWYGDGGCLDWQEELMRGQESRRLMSWIEPKKAHKRFVTALLQLDAHVILCFRAEPKVEVGKDEDGKTAIVPKKTITGGGLDGWIPVAEKGLPFEMTASFLLMADAPGVPRPMKLQEQHKAFVPLDAPLDENVGRALGEWAAGADVAKQLADRLLELAPTTAKAAEFAKAIAANRDQHKAAPERHLAWLRAQLAKIEAKAKPTATPEPEPEPAAA